MFPGDGGGGLHGKIILRQSRGVIIIETHLEGGMRNVINLSFGLAASISTEHMSADQE